MIDGSQIFRENRVASMTRLAMQKGGMGTIEGKGKDRNQLKYIDEDGREYTLIVKQTGWHRPEEDED